LLSLDFQFFPHFSFPSNWFLYPYFLFLFLFTFLAIKFLFIILLFSYFNLFTVLQSTNFQFKIFQFKIKDFLWILFLPIHYFTYHQSSDQILINLYLLFDLKNSHFKHDFFIISLEFYFTNYHLFGFLSIQQNFSHISM
jgi:hypothetical protein